MIDIDDAVGMAGEVLDAKAAADWRALAGDLAADGATEEDIARVRHRFGAEHVVNRAEALTIIAARLRAELIDDARVH